MKHSVSFALALSVVTAGSAVAQTIPHPDAEAFCKAYDWTGNSTTQEITLYSALSTATGIRCRDKDVSSVQASKVGSELYFGDDAYHLDGIMNGDELLRVKFIGDCVPVDASGTVIKNPNDKRVIERVAICGPDYRRMDRKAYDARIASLKLSPAIEKAAGAYFDIVKTTFGAIHDAVKAKGNAASNAVLFDTPERIWKEWETKAAEYSDALKALDELEPKFVADYKKGMRLPQPVLSPPAGCDSVNSAIAKLIKDEKVTTRELFAQAIQTPIGTTLATAKMICEVYTGRYVVAAAYKELFYSKYTTAKNIFRGPRHAVLHGMKLAFTEYRQKGGSELISRDDIQSGHRSHVMHWLENGLEDVVHLSDDRVNTKTVGEQKYDVPGGVVMAVGKHPYGVELKFKKSTWEIPEYDCKDTGRTRGWQSDGTRIAERDCKFTGKTIKKSVDHPPVVVPASFASLIKPGTVVTLRTGVALKNGQRVPGNFEVGYPMEVFKGKKVVSLYEFPVP
jgi:hypothetical protein